MPWWAWPLLLFAVAFLLGIVAVIGGIGGGVLFVPIVGGFFPFHLDFVRGAGLLLALSGSLSAGPALLRGGLASLRLAMPARSERLRSGAPAPTAASERMAPMTSAPAPCPLASA